MSLGFAQTLTIMSDRRAFWGKARQGLKANSLIIMCEPTVYTMCDT
jgi:hypothetical protein